MSLAAVFGIKAPPPLKDITESAKKPAISPFDFVNAIQYSKEELIVDEWSEKQYNAYIINRALSMGVDTVLAANEMNARPWAPRKAQFDYLCGIITPKKRFNKWIKGVTDEKIEFIQDQYQCNARRAREMAELITDDQIDELRARMKKGGLDASN